MGAGPPVAVFRRVGITESSAVLWGGAARMAARQRLALRHSKAEYVLPLPNLAHANAGSILPVVVEKFIEEKTQRYLLK
jgi:hypothetical protein